MTYQVGDVVLMGTEWGGGHYLIVRIDPTEGLYTGLKLRTREVVIAMLRDANIEKKLATEDFDVLADVDNTGDGEQVVWF